MKLSEAKQLYIEKHTTLAPRTIYDYNYILSEYAGELFERDLVSISVDDVEAVYARACARSVSQAYKLLQLAANVIDYAVGRKKLSGIENNFRWFIKYGEKKKVQGRKRVLHEKHFATFYDELDLMPLDCAVYMLLLLYTGARKEEIGNLTWDEVDLVQGVIEMQGKSLIRGGHPRRKVDEGLKIVLSDVPARLLYRLWIRRRSPVGNVYVFDWRCKIAYADIVERTGINCRPHDLRRTFISVAKGIGIDHMAAKKLAGHKLPDITSSYEHHLEVHAREFNRRIVDEMLRLAGRSGAVASPCNSDLRFEGSVYKEAA